MTPPGRSANLPVWWSTRPPPWGPCGTTVAVVVPAATVAPAPAAAARPRRLPPHARGGRRPPCAAGLPPSPSPLLSPLRCASYA